MLAGGNFISRSREGLEIGPTIRQDVRNRANILTVDRNGKVTLVAFGVLSCSENFNIVCSRIGNIYGEFHPGARIDGPQRRCILSQFSTTGRLIVFKLNGSRQGTHRRQGLSSTAGGVGRGTGGRRRALGIVHHVEVGVVDRTRSIATCFVHKHHFRDFTKL